MDSLSNLDAIERSGDTLFHTYFDISPDCMFHIRVEADGRLVYDAANRTALTSVGLTLDQLLGKTPAETLGPDKGRSMAEALRIVCETGKSYRYEPTWELLSGPVTYDAVYIPEKNGMGDVVGILGIARNITKQRALEASLHQARKMEAMGQLASGVAHDFNNILATIQACLSLLKRQFKLAGAQQLIEEGLRTVRRGKTLTDRMLAFAHVQPQVLQPLDLSALLDETLTLLRRTLGASILIDLEVHEVLWPTLGDRNELEVAFLNIAINARDAMPGGGKLTIVANNITVAPGENATCSPGDYCLISFTDTGEGIPHASLSRVLQPFFTTKPPGKGTGLGLSMVKSMIERIGGTISIESEKAVGTTVKLYFRRAESLKEQTIPNARPLIPPEQVN